jgi:hypothetical protein
MARDYFGDLRRAPVITRGAGVLHRRTVKTYGYACEQLSKAEHKLA